MSFWVLRESRVWSIFYNVWVYINGVLWNFEIIGWLGYWVDLVFYFLYLYYLGFFKINK